MKELAGLYSLIKPINEIVRSERFSRLIRELNQLKRVTIQNSSIAADQAAKLIDELISIVSPVQTMYYSSEQLKFVDKIGIKTLIGDYGTEYLETVKNQIQANPLLASPQINSLIDLVTQYKTKVSQYFTLLRPFEGEADLSFTSSTSNVVEIVFQGGASIDTFAQAKQQAEDWNLIVLGYAKMLQIQPDEFEIVWASKASPMKWIFGVGTAIHLWLAITKDVLDIKLKMCEHEMMISTWEQKPFVRDPEMRSTLIARMKSDYQVTIREMIDQSVQRQLAELGFKNADGDVINHATKCIEKQYNFITNGGSVSIYINEDGDSRKAPQIEDRKRKLAMLQHAVDQQSIGAGEILEADNQGD